MYGYKHFVAAVSNFRIEIGKEKKKNTHILTFPISFESLNKEASNFQLQNWQLKLGPEIAP